MPHSLAGDTEGKGAVSHLKHIFDPGASEAHPKGIDVSALRLPKMLPAEMSCSQGNNPPGIA